MLLLFLCPSKTLVSYLCASLRTSRCTHEDRSLDWVFMQTILLQNIACHSRKNYGTQNSFHSGDPPHEWQKLQQSLDNQKVYAKGPLETTTHRIGYSQKMDHRRLDNFIYATSAGCVLTLDLQSNKILSVNGLALLQECKLGKGLPLPRSTLVYVPYIVTISVLRIVPQFLGLLQKNYWCVVEPWLM